MNNLNLKGVTVGTWVRLAAMVLTVVNMILAETGHNPISVSDDELYSIVSLALMVAASVAAFWKNNSFTEAAQAADSVLNETKGNPHE